MLQAVSMDIIEDNYKYIISPGFLMYLHILSYAHSFTFRSFLAYLFPAFV